MLTLVRITQMVLGMGAVILTMFTPFMIPIAWGRIIATYFKNGSFIVWTVVSLLLLLPIGLAFYVSLVISHGAIPDSNFWNDYWSFNSHPLWWLVSLLGFLPFVSAFTNSRATRATLILAGILYVLTLVSAPGYIQQLNASDTNSAAFIVAVFAYYADPFLTSALFLVSVASAFQPNRRYSTYLPIASLVVAVLITFVQVVFPWTD